MKALHRTAIVSGISLESINAQKGKSMYQEPVFQYFPDTQNGIDLPDSTANGRDSLINEHKRQAGVSARCKCHLVGCRPVHLGQHSRPGRRLQEQPRRCSPRGQPDNLGLQQLLLRRRAQPPAVPVGLTRTRASGSSNSPTATARQESQGHAVLHRFDRNSNTFTYYPSNFYSPNYEGSEWSGGRMIYSRYPSWTRRRGRRSGMSSPCSARSSSSSVIPVKPAR